MICFYHLFQPGGDLKGGWRQLFHQQMSEYEDSGLVEAGCRIHLGVIGSEDDRAELKRRIAEHYPFITVVVEKDLSENDDWYEGATLESLWNWVDHETIKHRLSNPFKPVPATPVLYWHSKGAVTANKHTVNHRRLMTYYCVEQWRDAVAAIEQGASAAGCEWRHAGGWHFSGNFWWANSSYLAGLMNPMTDCAGFDKGYYHAGPDGGDNSRIKFEMWIGSGSPKVCELFQSGGINWYTHSLTRRLYAKGGGWG